MLIAQITDPHMVPKESHWLSQPETEIRERFVRVIEYINRLHTRPDVVVLTGDATDEGDAASYQHLKELLQPLKTPFFVIPGNHDRREAMRAAFSHHAYMPKTGFIHYAVEEYPVRLVCLDTLVEGEHLGLLCKERMEWLEKTLEAEPEKPTLIFMHHPPAKTGTKLFDTMICFAPPQLESLVREHHQVLGIMTGHYHHLCITSFGGKSCFLAPSIAPVHYFAHPEDDQVSALELEDPAITFHYWHEGSRLRSHVVRVKDQVRRIDWKMIQENRQRN